VTLGRLMLVIGLMSLTVLLASTPTYAQSVSCSQVFGDTMFHGKEDPAWQLQVKRKIQAAKNFLPGTASVEFDSIGTGIYDVSGGSFNVTKPFRISKFPVSNSVWRGIISEAAVWFPEKYNSLPRDFSSGRAHGQEETERVFGPSLTDVRRWLRAVKELQKIGSPIVKRLMPELGEDDQIDVPSYEELLLGEPVPYFRGGFPIYEWTSSRSAESSKSARTVDLTENQMNASPYFDLVDDDNQKGFHMVIRDGTRVSSAHSVLAVAFQGSKDPAWKAHLAFKVEQASGYIPASKTLEFDSIGRGTYRVTAGSFKVDQEFLISRIPVNRSVWRLFLAAAQAKYPGEYDHIPLEFEKESHAYELKPVVGPSHWQIEVWLHACNRMISDGNPIVKKLMPELKKGDTINLPFFHELMIGVPVPYSSANIANWEWIANFKNKRQSESWIVSLNDKYMTDSRETWVGKEGKAGFHLAVYRAEPKPKK
jgi:hypothetical protein